MPTLLISWVVMGLFTGTIVYLFATRRPLGGAPVCMLVGIAGSFLAGYIVANELRLDILHGPITWGSLLTSFVGGILGGIVWTIATRPAPDSAE